eukprot:2839531-Rhodomonas_salina.2
MCLRCLRANEPLCIRCFLGALLLAMSGPDIRGTVIALTAYACMQVGDVARVPRHARHLRVLR